MDKKQKEKKVVRIFLGIIIGVLVTVFLLATVSFILEGKEKQEEIKQQNSQNKDS